MSKRTVAGLALVALVAALLLWLGLRGGGSPAPATATETVEPTAPSARRAPTATKTSPRVNELGQPLDENGRPIGPPPRNFQNARTDPSEVPITPPRFDDESDRAEYKEWWVRELGRRARVYQKLEPREGYPSDEDLERLLAEMYDASEPRGADESVDDAYERRKRLRELRQEFQDSFGTTPKTVATRGGDPQYGQPEEPPVEPANQQPKHPEAMPPAAMNPPR